MPTDESTPDPMLVQVGTRIRQRRLKLGMTQVELGEATTLNQGFVWRIETGRQNLELRTLARVALALRTTMDALLKGIAPDPAHLPRRRSTKAIVSSGPPDDEGRETLASAHGDDDRPNT